jgi:N6-L-threonylcarbamoyladenine synthase
MNILAIESSCDETAAAVIEKTGLEIRILSNIVASQIPIHKKYGGVFPEMASRAHTEKIIEVANQAINDNNIEMVAVTTGPGLIGSLLIGVNFAKTYAYINNLPIIGVNHLLGHIYSNFSENLPQFPALILIVSGGHTGLYLMKSHTDITTLGETLDDAAGEAFDKVAKLLDLGYPGGPSIAAEAAKFKIHNSKFLIHLPRPMLNSEDYNFSFSGLKTAVLHEVRKITDKHPLTTNNKIAIAHEFQQAVIDTLIGKTLKAAQEFKPKSICLCGGVSANKELREQFQKSINSFNQLSDYQINFYSPPMSLTTDNAAMIGLAAAYHIDQKTTYDKINADANLKL